VPKLSFIQWLHRDYNLKFVGVPCTICRQCARYKLFVVAIQSRRRMHEWLLGYYSTKPNRIFSSSHIAPKLLYFIEKLDSWSLRQSHRFQWHILRSARAVIEHLKSGSIFWREIIFYDRSVSGFLWILSTAIVSFYTPYRPHFNHWDTENSDVQSFP